MPELLRYATRSHVVFTSVKIALVVGTILNVINQGEALLAHGSFSVFYGILNYLVPYCVSTYSAAKNETSRKA